jgi:hypothetical protein
MNSIKPLKVTRVRYVVTSYAYSCAFMRDVNETGSDRRNDYDSALDFRTAKAAQAWITRNGDALGLRNLREYGVERICLVGNEAFCDVGEIPGENGTVAIKYKGEVLAGIRVN